MSKFLIAVLIINACLVSILLFKIKGIDSDKGVTLLYFYYPILGGLNLLLGIIFQFVNRRIARVFIMATAILILSILPIILIVSTFE